MNISFNTYHQCFLHHQQGYFVSQVNPDLKQHFDFQRSHSLLLQPVFLQWRMKRSHLKTIQQTRGWNTSIIYFIIIILFNSQNEIQSRLLYHQQIACLWGMSFANFSFCSKAGKAEQPAIWYSVHVHSLSRRVECMTPLHMLKCSEELRISPQVSGGRRPCLPFCSEADLWFWVDAFGQLLQGVKTKLCRCYSGFSQPCPCRGW